MKDKKTLQEIISKIKGSKTAVVMAHQNPDGDTLGSMLAIGAILKDLGFKVDHVMSDPVPEVFQFLPYSDLVMKPDDNRIQKEHDLSFSLDCGSLKRLGKAGEIYGKAKERINIDHHISNEKFGTLNWIEAEATSTGQLVYLLANELKINISKEVATLLYTTLLTDTGCFANSNTNADALMWASELIKLGADYENVYRKAFLEKPLRMMKVFGVGLNNLSLSEDGNVAWTYVSKEDMKRLSATSEDTEDIADYIMRTKGVKVGIFFREDEKEVKVSLRSVTDFDVSKIAVSFGGGGHKRAAGINIKKPFSEVRDLILSKVKGEFKDFNGRK